VQRDDLESRASLDVYPGMSFTPDSRALIATWNGKLWRVPVESGGPVGLLTADNQLYLVVGDHEPMNKELAAKAAQTVTLKGKVVERNGMKMIENAELQP
jgi:hypothetical protein